MRTIPEYIWVQEFRFKKKPEDGQWSGPMFSIRLEEPKADEKSLVFDLLAVRKFRLVPIDSEDKSE